MRNPAIRLVIILGVIAITGIISIQVYFFQISFNNEERKLNQKIQVALWSVVEQIYELNNIEYVGKNPVYQYSYDYYVVNVNDFIDADILEHFLIRTFDKQNIKLDFEYAIYDCHNDEMLYGNYIDLSKQKNKPQKIKLPKHDDFVYYFGIYFPWRNKYLFGNLDSVYILSSILIFVILFLGYAITFILKQRRFSELQKSVVNNLTHEFKTPLSSIMLSAEIFNEKNLVNEPERVKRYSDIIKSQANYLLGHVERVLGMSKIENMGKLNLEKLKLHEIFSNITDKTFWKNYAEGEIELSLNAKNDEICADKFHFNNVLVNIIDNSLKFSNKKPLVSIKTKSDKKHLSCIIKDNGIGIDKKYQKKIFKQFFRVPTGNIHNVKGFGMGLSYVKNIIKKHKWNYKFKSIPGKGTEFIILIPLNAKTCE